MTEVFLNLLLAGKSHFCFTNALLNSIITVTDYIKKN